MRAFDGLHELAHALIVKALGVGQGVDGDVVFEAVFAALHFLAHVLPLPRHPVGDMRKLRLPLFGMKFTQLAHLPHLLAGVAPELGALRIHFEFLLAVRALIEDVVQPFGALFICVADALFLLPGVFVALQFLVDARVEFGGRERLDFLRIRDADEVGAHGKMLLHLVPLRRGDEGAVHPEDDDGDLHELARLAQRIGQKGRRAIEGVARLGIDADDIPEGVDAILHVLDEVQVFDELALADAPQLPHEPVAHVADGVDGDDVVGAVGRHRLIHEGEIEHARVRRKQKIGRLDALHIDLVDGDGPPLEAGVDGKLVGDPHPQFARLFGFARKIVALGFLVLFHLFFPLYSLVRDMFPFIV